MADKEIPGVEGQVELNWVTGPGAVASLPSANGGSVAEATASGPQKSQAKVAEDTAMDGADGPEKDSSAAAEQAPEQTYMDYDVADENQWDIG